jgi:large subunit ribosomal protein L10
MSELRTKPVRLEKQAMMREIVKALEASEYMFALTYAGLTVPKLKELRSNLAETNAKAKIVKNNMLRKALAERGWQVPDTLVGPTAMITGKGEITEVEVPPREIMLGMFLGTLAAPMSGLVGVMSGKLRSLLYVLKAVEQKKGGNA